MRSESEVEKKKSMNDDICDDHDDGERIMILSRVRERHGLAR